MAGGRPRNDWRASRERKLARLYILSHIGWDEIREVLREEGFNPSLSDMQKRLRALLPNDYAVCYRGYHPSSHNQAKSRFSQLKFCTNDRVRKYRKSRLHAKADRKRRTSYTAPGLDDPEFAGPTKAFKNYYVGSSHLPGLSVIPSWLHFIANDDSPISSSKSIARTPYTISAEPFNVHNNEASTYETVEDKRDSSEPFLESTNCDKSPAATAKGGLAQYTKSIGCHQESVQLAEDLNPSPVSNSQGLTDQLSSPQPLTLNDSSQRASIASGSFSTLFSRKLAGRHSRASLELIESIVRHSLPNSLRSSLMSWRSSANSRNSVASSTQDIEPASEDTAPCIGSTGSSGFLQKSKSRLTEGEQRIWDDLVDETQLAPRLATEIPSYPEISLLSRPCCAMLGDSKCQTCGFSKSHRQAILWTTHLPRQLYIGESLPYLHDKDHFQNTPLHFAAANGRRSLLAMIRWLLSKGVDIKVTNTSGETFMHVLNSALLNDTKEYISVLELLAKHDFPLLRRNHHGRSLADIYFTAVNPKEIPFEHLSAIISHLKPNNYENERQRRLNIDTLLARCRESVSQKQLPTHRSVWNTLTKKPTLVKLVEEMEKSGDSSLIQLVKNWPESCGASQLGSVIYAIFRCGAEENLRDRNGDTALAIAAKRGLRPAVFWLIGLSANPNSRDYQGNGILSQATKCLLRTQTDTKQYAGILSCIAELTDCGAKANPTVYDEWFVTRFNNRAEGAIIEEALENAGLI